MDGIAGYAGWRWVYIIEGIVTCAAGLLGCLLIVDFPEEATASWKFLNAEEAKIVIERIQQDRSDADTPPFHLLSYLSNALDWKIWCFAANFGATANVTYATLYFLPTILKNELGFSEVAALCLTTPVSHLLLPIHNSE